MGPSAWKGYTELVIAYVNRNTEEAEVMGAGVSLDVFTRSTNSLLQLSKEVVGYCKHALCVHVSTTFKTQKSSRLRTSLMQPF